MSLLLDFYYLLQDVLIKIPKNDIVTMGNFNTKVEVTMMVWIKLQTNAEWFGHEMVND